MEKNNYYFILGVKQDAKPDEIKAAFRKLANLYHPDKYETGDEMLYMRVVDAYKILIDPEARSEYDKFGFVSDAYGPAIDRLKDAMLGIIKNTPPPIDAIDFIYSLRANIDDVTKKYEASIESIKEESKKYQSVINKIKRKSSKKTGPNIFKIALDEKLEQLDKEILNNQTELRVLGRMIEILEYYEQDIQLFLPCDSFSFFS